MKTGTELIAIERQEQIEKHGRTLQRDIAENQNLELLIGAMALLDVYPSTHSFPEKWNKTLIQKMMSKPHKDRLVIAGALIAAQIDVMQGTTSGSRKREKVKIFHVCDDTNDLEKQINTWLDKNNVNITRVTEAASGRMSHYVTVLIFYID